MAIQKIPDLRSEQRISEYCVGVALSSIIYPGIDQCISVTGWSKFDLLGSHISPGSTKQDIDDILQLLGKGGAEYTKWYLVGNFVTHAQYTQIGWNSLATVGKAVKKRLSKSATLSGYDTTAISTAYAGWGVNIRAEHQAGGIAFSTSKYPGDNPYTTIPPNFVAL